MMNLKASIFKIKKNDFYELISPYFSLQLSVTWETSRLWKWLESREVIPSFFDLNDLDCCLFLSWPVFGLRSTSLNQAWFRALSSDILTLGSFVSNLFSKSLHRFEWFFQHGRSNSSCLFKVMFIVSRWDSWSKGREPERSA